MGMRSQENQILIDADILSDSYLLPEIPLRELQVSRIATCLRPITEGRKPVHCWLHGKPGVGKTRLQTWFYDQTGNELCGAFYVRVYRK